jgi:hypothetical protein
VLHGTITTTAAAADTFQRSFPDLYLNPHLSPHPASVIWLSFSILMMEAVGSSEMSVNFYRTTQRHNHIHQ